MKKKLVFFNFIFLLIVFSYSVYKEEMYQRADTFYIKTVPVDPRSLIQGDYMILNYQITEEALRKLYDSNSKEAQGYLRLKIDPNTKVAELIALESTLLPEKDNEISVKFNRNASKNRNNRGMDIGVNSYMFQEGTAEKYTDAAYSEVILLRGNKLRLKNLVDKDFKKLN